MQHSTKSKQLTWVLALALNKTLGNISSDAYVLVQTTVSSFLPFSPPTKTQASDCKENTYTKILGRSRLHHFLEKLPVGPCLSLAI